MFAKQIIILKNEEVMAAIDLPKATQVSSTDNQSTRLLNLEDYEAQRLQTFLSMLDYDAEIIPSVHKHKSHLVLIAFNSNKFGLNIRLSVIP